MEWISNLINGINGKWVLVFVLAILVQLFYSIKNGTVNFNGHGLQVGKTRDSELRIVREQLQYMRKKISASLTKVPEKLRTGRYFYKAKYWWSELENACESIIIYNHITADDVYIKLKQDSFYDLMLTTINDNNEYWSSPEFRGLIYNTIKELIEELVKVRETYSKKDLV